MTDQDKVEILLADDQPAKVLTYEAILEPLALKPGLQENGTRSASGLSIRHGGNAPLTSRCLKVYKYNLSAADPLCGLRPAAGTT
jgi:hypothetical protein